MLVIFFVYKSGDNFIFELKRATGRYDSGVGVGVALCIVRTGFYSQNYVFLVTAAIRLTGPLSGGGAGVVSKEGGCPYTCSN